MKLQTRLILWLLGALLTILIPLGLFTVREARQAARRTLEDNIAARLGLLRMISGDNLAALAALAQEFGGYGYIVSGDNVRYSDTAERELPSAVREALAAGAPYRNLLGNTLYVALPFTDTGGLGLAAPLTAVTTLTNRLIIAYLLAATALFVIVGLLSRYLLTRLLTPLRQLAEAITRRDAANLEPLPATTLPEMQPVVARLNELLVHLKHSLSRSHSQAEAARRFAAQASHELRTPLTALRGYLDILGRNPHEHRALEGALRQGRRLQQLLESLLHLARVEGRADLQLTRLALAPFIQRHFPNVTVQGDATILAEAALFELALTNLIRNAQCYGAPPIAVAIERDDNRVSITVTDSGPGFPEALLAEALKPFVHGDGSGTGLGLAIVQAIMAAHHGSVTLSNLPEGGAAVALHFRLT